jgi:polysaccharide biosynthesis/export protein
MKTVLFACSVLAAFAAALPAQPREFAVSAKDRTISTPDLIRELSAPPVESYNLYPGDEIFIEIWGRPELSGKHVVGPDGKVTLPIAGPLKIADLTREAAQEAIREALTHFYSEISATIRVDHYASYHVYVLGRVTNPGALQFDTQPTLLQVLTRAGSLPVGGAGAEKAGLVRCAIFRGSDKIVWVDLKLLLAQGNLSLNIPLARNDLVYLPDADDQLVYVLGSVTHPGALRLTASMSFLDALSLSGGPTEDAASRHMALIRPSTGKQIEISMKEILSGKRELDMTLEEGDILYVPESNVAKFGYLMQKASPLTAFAVVSNAIK